MEYTIHDYIHEHSCSDHLKESKTLQRQDTLHTTKIISLFLTSNSIGFNLESINHSV